MCVDLHVIIADDDDAIRLLLGRIVPRVLPGASVTIVHDGTDALRVYNERGADLLITDYMMPTLSGLELLERLRAQGATLPVLIVSALLNVPTQMRHDVYFIAKPFKVAEIEAAILHLLAAASDSSPVLTSGK